MLWNMHTDTLTYREAAELLGVSRATLYRMIGDGILRKVDQPTPSGRRTVPRVLRHEIEQRKATLTAVPRAAKGA